MFLKKLDLLSPSITLYTNGHLSHSSIFSGIFTLVTYSILLAMGVYFALDIIQRNNPTAFYFNRYAEDAGFFPLNSSLMFNFIQITDTISNALVPVDFNSLSIIGLQVTIDIYISDRNLKNYNHWIYGKCNDNSDIKGIEKLIKYNKFTESACIRQYFDKKTQRYYNTNENGFIWPSLDKGCSHPNMTFYGIIIEKCRNDIINNKCKTDDEIKIYINKL